MNTTTLPAPSFTVTSDASPRAAALRAEWTKLRTLRSVWMTMAVAVVASVTLAALSAGSNARDWKDMPVDEQLAFDPVAVSLIGVLFGALVLGALGVRTMSSEYSTGMIRSTAAAIPRRTRFLWSKVIVVAGTTFLVAMIANVAGFVIGQAALRGEGLDVSITADGSIDAIVAGAVAVSAFAVIGVGLATIVKRGIGGQHPAGTRRHRRAAGRHSNAGLGTTLLAVQRIASVGVRQAADELLAQGARSRSSSATPWLRSSSAHACSSGGMYERLGHTHRADTMLVALDRLRERGPVCRVSFQPRADAADAMIRLGGGDRVESWVENYRAQKHTTTHPGNLVTPGELARQSWPDRAPR